MTGKHLLGIMVVALALGLGGAVARADTLDMSSLVQHQTLPQEDLDQIASIFPESRMLDQSLLAPDGGLGLEFYSDAQVSLTFVGEGAGYKNTLGYFLYDDNGNILGSQTIFSNASAAGSGGSLLAGDTVNLGNFSAGTNLGFWLKADGYNNSSGYTYYSLEKYNPDGQNHFALWVDAAHNRIVYGIEDLYNLGDGDYNDVLFTVNLDPYTETNHTPGSDTPEPATMAMMLSGLCCAAWLRRRQTAA